MRTIAFLTAVLVAAPAFAGPCVPANDDTEYRLFRYSAPADSAHAGAVIEFVGEDMGQMTPAKGAPIEIFGQGCGDFGVRCHRRYDGGTLLFAELYSDSEIGIFKFGDEPAMRWQADCQ